MDGEQKSGVETSVKSVQTEEPEANVKISLEETTQRNFYDALLDPEVAKWIVQSENSMARITKQYAQIQQENNDLREQLVSMVKLNKQQIRNKQYE